MIPLIQSSETNLIKIDKFLEDISASSSVKTIESIASKALKSIGDNIDLQKPILERVADRYSKIREFQLLEKYCIRLEAICTMQKDYTGLATVYFKLGIVYRNFGNYAKAHEVYKQCYTNIKKTGNKIGLSKISNNIANLYKDNGDLTNALEYYIKSKEILENEPGVTLYMVNQNLAQVYLLLNYDNKAREHCMIGFGDMIKEKNYQRVATSLNILGEIQRKNGKLQKAKKTINKAIHFWKKDTNLKKGLGEAYLILGKIYTKLNENEEAILQYLKSTELCEAAYHMHGAITSLSLLGKEFVMIDDINTATKYLHQAQSKAEKIGANFELIEVLDLLHNIYQKQGLYKEAYEALQSYNFLKEKVYNLSAQVKINEAQTKYELDKKELSHQKERELSDYKFNLFSHLTHEFRTPLTLIKTPIELIKDEENLFVVREKINIIEQSTNHLLRLVNQLLDINKIEAGKMPVSYKVGTVLPISGHVIHLFSEEANSKNINFTYSLPTSEIQGVFDEDKLEKILNNLLSNAYKFTSNGGNIHLNIQTLHDQLLIKIMDTGAGIAESDMGRIFEKFYRAGSSSKISGSGLGLSFVKELVELLEGTIEVQSEEGKGSVFTVRLPFKNVEQIERKFIESIANEPRIIPISDEVLMIRSDKKATMLIVEDNTEIQKLIADIFSKKYKIVKADNGEEGIKIARSIIPDIIISDIMMPIKDGYDLCHYLKDDMNTCHIPIVLLTAKTTIQEKIKGIDKGADAYLSKPFNISELTSIIENLVHQRQVMREHYAQNALFTADKKHLISADEVFIKTVSDFVILHLADEKLTVENVADELMMSRFTLIRKFKAILNVTPNDFIQKVRLDTAKDMLAAKVASISEIAYKVGYASVTYFSSSFKKEFGKTPREWYNGGGE